MKIIDRTTFFKDMNIGYIMIRNDIGIEYIYFNFGFGSKFDDNILGLLDFEVEERTYDSINL